MLDLILITHTWLTNIKIFTIYNINTLYILKGLKCQFIIVGEAAGHNSVILKTKCHF